MGHFYRKTEQKLITLKIFSTSITHTTLKNVFLNVKCVNTCVYMHNKSLWSCKAEGGEYACGLHTARIVLQ